MTWVGRPAASYAYSVGCAVPAEAAVTRGSTTETNRPVVSYVYWAAVVPVTAPAAGSHDQALTSLTCPANVPGVAPVAVVVDA